MGEEHFGNQPLAETNYTSWPDVVPLVNAKNRVYHQWVNGDENFFYRGSTDDLNAAIKDFAKVKSDKLEVVLRPGPGIAKTFSPEKTVPFDWNLHLVGGIAAHMSTRDQGQQIWSTYPVLTIYVDEQIELNKIQIPKELKVTELAELKQRALKCLKSTDMTVRGWSCGYLAGLDKYDQEVMKRVAELLADDDNWVRLNAAGSLASYGVIAKSVLPKLEQLADTDDAQLRERVEKTIASIKQATPNDQAQAHYRSRLDSIRDYCESRR